MNCARVVYVDCQLLYARANPRWKSIAATQPLKLDSKTWRIYKTTQAHITKFSIQLIVHFTRLPTEQIKCSILVSTATRRKMRCSLAQSQIDSHENQEKSTKSLASDSSTQANSCPTTLTDGG
ncbi:hypothetical protein PM082_006243 [Marasmius tenuissimus]|nr:hypothetical protein PM082_006243 [Marasmius tenuissimus]